MKVNNGSFLIPKEIAQFLREAREKKGYTQGEFATLLGYTNPQFISNWERGIAKTPLCKWPLICRLLDIPPEVMEDKLTDAYRKSLKNEFEKEPQ